MALNMLWASLKSNKKKKGLKIMTVKKRVTLYTDEIESLKVAMAKVILEIKEIENKIEELKREMYDVRFSY